MQQPPIAASGFSSQAFAPHFPHTVRKEETKTCSGCHVSDKDDNNAIMAQLMLLGTNFVNFVGLNSWVGLRATKVAYRLVRLIGHPTSRGGPPHSSQAVPGHEACVES